MESSVVVKAFGLLEAARRAGAGRRLCELAAEVQISKPSAHRILQTLTALGYVERCAPGFYRQTAAARQSFAGEDEGALPAAGEAILNRLREQTRETVNLGVLRHGRILYLKVLESPRALRHASPEGSFDPFHSTALGRAIVAQLPMEQRRLLLGRTRLEARTPFTVTGAEEMHRILDKTKLQGFAYEEDQTDLGVTCVGAPVFACGAVVAAISVSLPTARFRAEAKPRLIKAIQSAANKLSACLGRRKNSAKVSGRGKTS